MNTSTSVELSPPSFEVLQDKQIDNQHVLRWSWLVDNPSVLPIQDSLTIQYTAQVKENSLLGEIENIVKVRSYAHAYLNDSHFIHRGQDEEGWYVYSTTGISVEN